MNHKIRMDQLKYLEDNQFYIEGTLDFSDCETTGDIIDATCQILVERFDIAHENTYIWELIQQACFESADRGIENDE